MTKYEIIFVVDSRLSDAEKSEVAKQAADLVTKVGGTVVSCNVWLERQKMAFTLRKAWEGTYYLMIAGMNGSEIARVRRELQINERVLRFLIVRMEEEKVAA